MLETFSFQAAITRCKLRFVVCAAASLHSAHAIGATCEAPFSDAYACHVDCRDGYGFSIGESYCTYGCYQFDRKFQRAYEKECWFASEPLTDIDIFGLIDAAVAECSNGIDGTASDLEAMHSGCQTEADYLRAYYQSR